MATNKLQQHVADNITILQNPYHFKYLKTCVAIMLLALEISEEYKYNRPVRALGRVTLSDTPGDLNHKRSKNKLRLWRFSHT